MYRVIFVLFLVSISSVYSKEKIDSIRHYKLGEIIATSKKKVKTIHKSTAATKNYFQIQNKDPESLSDIISEIPSAKINTNSRGESLIYLRGSGERQIGVYFDGAYFNIPWDNRLDLSLIPTDIIGQLQVENATSSVLKGANILGGTLEINSLNIDSEGYHGIINIQGADGGRKNISLTQDGRNGNFSYIFNYSYLNSDGIMLPNLDENINYQDSKSNLRTNSDINRNSFFGRVMYDFENTKIGLSYSGLRSDKGVAPEATASEKKVRFWRYNNWNRDFINANIKHKFNDNFNVNSTIWYDKFGQDITKYTDLSYSVIDNIQNDKDNSYGGRLLFNYLLNDDNDINFIMNYHGTQHEVRVDDSVLVYSQDLLSIAANYELSIDELVLEAGVGYDYLKTPKTGGSVENEGNTNTDFSMQLNANYNLSEKFNLFTAFAKKSRFPTLREKYDAALGKFTINPDLDPETGFLTEAGLDYTDEDLSIVGTYFNNYYTDLIGQIKLEDETKKRVNISEAVINGLELKFIYTPTSKLKLYGFFTYMDNKGYENQLDSSGNVIAEEEVKLEQKPNILGNIELSYKFPYQIVPSVEVEYTGKQYDSEVELDPTALLNFKLAYSFSSISESYSTVYVRVNNLTDEVKYSQLGLPGPGRTFMAGIKTNFNLF